MTNIFAELEVNPFEDDVVTEPRRVSFSVEGLNDKPLEQLIARFRELTEGELPRRQIAAQKAQLVVSPDRGYGKSHLLGRLFKRLEEEATLIYGRFKTLNGFGAQSSHRFSTTRQATAELLL